MEEWRTINDYPGYEVSNLGNVRNLDYNHTGKVKNLKSSKDSGGYCQVGLNGDSILVHKLVAEAFLDNPNGYSEINHIDKVRSNNCVNNLEYCSHQYNVDYSLSKAVLQFDSTGTVFIQRFKSTNEAERQTGINHRHISECCRGIHNTCGGYVWRYE